MNETDTTAGAIDDVLVDVLTMIESARSEARMSFFRNAQSDVKRAMDDLLAAYVLLAQTGPSA